MTSGNASIRSTPQASRSCAGRSTRARSRPRRRRGRVSVGADATARRQACRQRLCRHRPAREPRLHALRRAPAPSARPRLRALHSGREPVRRRLHGSPGLSRAGPRRARRPALPQRAVRPLLLASFLAAATAFAAEPRRAPRRVAQPLRRRGARRDPPARAAGGRHALGSTIPSTSNVGRPRRAAGLPLPEGGPGEAGRARARPGGRLRVHRRRFPAAAGALRTALAPDGGPGVARRRAAGDPRPGPRRRRAGAARSASSRATTTSSRISRGAWRARGGPACCTGPAG